MYVQPIMCNFSIFQSNNEVIHVFPLMNPNLIGTEKHVHEAFKEHGSKVISRVNEVLHNLDQLNLCVSLIKQTGAYHRRFQGFKPQFFQVRVARKVTNLNVILVSISMNPSWVWSSPV